LRPRLAALALLMLCGLALLLGPAPAQAAEVLQVRSGHLLQVGDHNRTYTVELACLAIPPGGEAAATAWLRNGLPRRTRVNLRPQGTHDGTLLAQVQPLQGGDLSDGLIAAGLASRPDDCSPTA
jgi:endonuclease YncB( thermonuclease family)